MPNSRESEAGNPPSPDAAAQERQDSEQEQLNARQEEVNAELARLEDRYKRALADLENFRKRTAREIERRVWEATESMLLDWLQAVDSVERAVRMEPEGPCADGLRAVLDLALEEAARGGKRWLSVDGRSVEVDIPRGVTDGDRIRVPGQGGAGVGGGPAGDLLLRVRLRPHPRFRVDGRDLYTDLAVSPWEAALGAQIPVATLDGTARVKVPPGSSSGRKLRLRGQGLPGSGGSPPGDLYAVVMIAVPKRLAKKERELFERLASVSKFDPRKSR